MPKPSIPCPCGSGQNLASCCGRFLQGQLAAPSAEALMRSRYTAYTLLREDYLLATWHCTTRPASLGLRKGPATAWLGLAVKHCAQQDDDHATVEFVARHSANGRIQRLHEVSRFVRQEGHWYYLDGEVE